MQPQGPRGVPGHVEVDVSAVILNFAKRNPVEGVHPIAVCERREPLRVLLSERDVSAAQREIGQAVRLSIDSGRLLETTSESFDPRFGDQRVADIVVVNTVRWKVILYQKVLDDMSWDRVLQIERREGRSGVNYRWGRRGRTSRTEQGKQADQKFHLVRGPSWKSASI